MQPRLIELVVEIPKGAANAYEWDARAQTIRLRTVRHGSQCRPFERGHVANSLTLYGEPLCAHLAVSFPTFGGCRVTARVIGALEYKRDESTETCIVAVAQADGRLETVTAFGDLDAKEQQFVDAELRAGARWLDVEQAYEIVLAARRRGRLASTENDTNPAAPTWQMNEDDAVLAQGEQGPVRFSLAETRLYTLPLRFQDYVAALLAPNERILMWVYRPLIKPPRLRGLWGEILRQGLVVLTDQQFLWLRDPVTPSHTVAGYGFIARTFAIERIARTELKAKRDVLEFRVSLPSPHGDTETFSIEFPHEARAELEEGARLLQRFAPRSNETRLSRRTMLTPFHGLLGDPTTGDQTNTHATLERLQAALQAELRAETIFAQAFVPEWGEARLLTVTNRFVRMTPDPQKRAVSHAIPLAAIGSVEICCSQLGSWLRVWLPKPIQTEKWEMTFPPVFEREFSACVVAIRAGCRGANPRHWQE